MTDRNKKGQFIAGNQARLGKTKTLVEKLEYFGETLCEEYSRILGYPVTRDEAIFIRLQMELSDPTIPMNSKLLQIYLDRRYGKVTQSLEINKTTVTVDDAKIQQSIEKFREQNFLRLESDIASSERNIDIRRGTDCETATTDEMAEASISESSEE
jgi:hypothetical protein